MIYIVTPCSRPKNLPKIEKSIRRVISPQTDFKWFICYDTMAKDVNESRVKNELFEMNNVYVQAAGHTVSQAGNYQRNICLDTIAKILKDSDEDPWIHFLDDDNLMHPSLPGLLDTHNDYDAVFVPQVFIEGAIRLKPRLAEIERFKVDSAMALFKWHVIKDLRWELPIYWADAIFIQEAYKRSKKAIATNTPAAYYNALDPNRDLTFKQ